MQDNYNVLITNEGENVLDLLEELRISALECPNQNPSYQRSINGICDKLQDWAKAITIDLEYEDWITNPGIDDNIHPSDPGLKAGGMNHFQHATYSAMQGILSGATQMVKEEGRWGISVPNPERVAIASVRQALITIKHLNKIVSPPEADNT